MSDTAQGPGWWFASDGKWYPPELWTGRANAETTPAHPTHGYGQFRSYGASSTTTTKTNGLAIASLICSCAGLLVLPIIAGVILGFVALAQIKRSNGMQRGDGLAVAGIIVGFGWMVFLALGLALNAGNSNSSGVTAPFTTAPFGAASLVT